MTTKKFFVVPSAYEKSVKFDEPNLFLGEWCFPSEKKDSWSNLDYKVLRPLFYDKQTKDKMHNEIRIFQEKLLKILSKILNEHHKVKLSDREWKILMGHWLRRGTETILNRIYIVKASIEDFNLKGIYEFKKYDLSVDTPLTFISAANDNKWNSALISKIYRYYVNRNNFFFIYLQKIKKVISLYIQNYLI